MALIRRLPATSTSSAIFGGAPYQTNSPTQGSITFFHDDSCGNPLADMPSALVLGVCQNVPIPKGILGVSIDTLPTCDNYGTPILVVSDQPDCKNSTVGADADSGRLDQCQAYSSGTALGSVKFICYGNGIAPVSPMTTSADQSYASSTGDSYGDGYTDNPTTTATQTVYKNGGGDGGGGGGGGDSCDCCCCCTVM